MVSIPEINRIINKLVKAEPLVAELRRRYSECNKEEHIAPNLKYNRCVHCYVRLSYGVYRGNAKDYDNKAEIESVMDYFTGLKILRGDSAILEMILSQSSSSASPHEKQSKFRIL